MSVFILGYPLVTDALSLRQSFSSFGTPRGTVGRRVDGESRVVRAVAVAALLSAPEVMEGVINFRAGVVPALDIRSGLGLSARSLRSDQHFRLAEVGSRPVALRADRVFDLLDVRPDQIAAAERVAPGAVGEMRPRLVRRQRVPAQAPSHA